MIKYYAIVFIILLSLKLWVRKEIEMEFRTAIVDELGDIIYWRDELQQDEIYDILASHPEWCMKAIEVQ